MVHRVTSNDNEWQRMTANGTTNDIEWYNEWQRVIQRVTTGDNEQYSKWQRVTTSDNERQRLTKDGNGWQRMTASDKTNEYEWK